MTIPLDSQLSSVHAELFLKQLGGRSAWCLNADPTNREATVANAKYLCFAKQDWNTGLELLSQYGDGEWKTAATAELNSPSTTDSFIDVGNQWWNVGDLAPPLESEASRVRAKHWYLKALASASSPENCASLAQKLLKRIDDVPLRPTLLRLQLETESIHHVRISGDGIQSQWVHYPAYATTVHSVEWKSRERNGKGSGKIELADRQNDQLRLLLRGLDFSTAEVVSEKPGEWYEGGAIQYGFAADHVDIAAERHSVGSVTVDVTLALECADFRDTDRFASTWRVSAYKWEHAGEAGPPTEEEWRTAIERGAVAQFARTRLELRDDPPTHSFPPDPNLPRDFFILRAESERNLPSGTYKVQTFADDGIRVYLDGERIIDAWSVGYKTNEATVTLDKAGRHDFAVEFFEYDKLMRLRLGLRRLLD